MSRGRPKTSDVPDIDVLRAVRHFHEDFRRNPTPEEALAHRWPPKLIIAKMDKLERRGLIECGVSLRTGWLTAAGRQRLQELERAVTV